MAGRRSWVIDDDGWAGAGFIGNWLSDFGYCSLELVGNGRELRVDVGGAVDEQKWRLCLCCVLQMWLIHHHLQATIHSEACEVVVQIIVNRRKNIAFRELQARSAASTSQSLRRACDLRRFKDTIRHLQLKTS